MEWINRINRHLLHRIGKSKARKKHDSAYLRLSPAFIDDLVTLHLVANEEFIGETLMLLGSLADGRLVFISEDDTDWVSVCEALDASGRLSLLLDTAKLKLLADEKRKSLCLLNGR